MHLYYYTTCITLYSIDEVQLVSVEKQSKYNILLYKKNDCMCVTNNFPSVITEIDDEVIEPDKKVEGINITENSILQPVDV